MTQIHTSQRGRYATLSSRNTGDAAIDALMDRLEFLGGAAEQADERARIEYERAAAAETDAACIREEIKQIEVAMVRIRN